MAEAQQNLLLASPFIKASQAGRIVDSLQRRDVQDKLQVLLITDIRPESALSGATDLEAIVNLGRNLSGFTLTHLPSLHAKVYVADDKMAVITSGNLTAQGVSGNIEYGVAFTESSWVQEIRTDFERYARLGAQIPLSEITSLAEELVELKGLFQTAQRSVRAQAKRAFEQKLQSAQVRVLRNRARGKTTHSILSETILFLLAKGPLTTSALHPLIQRLHPDICDDTVDRIIDGVHFGKKWKHHVRNAQQFLKRQGRIRYDGQRWAIAG
ncbi:MAG TPA: phospholipase D-like domain-containing protein [Terriglobia bacterium]|nr:phospholipase D-like domain-containing protein [Terriglobia bacterium]